MIDYMRGSLCTLSEDGMQCSLGSGWSHDVMCAHLKFSAGSDAILGFSNVLQVLSTVEGANCLFEDAKDNSVHNSAPK